MQTAHKQMAPLEQKQRLSQSVLWQLQRAFFEQQGIEAWRSGVVPHHITNSPYTVDAFTRVVLGFYRDCYSAGAGDKESAFAQFDRGQPIYIVELGSGSGRFAYLFLKRFLDACRNSALKEIRIKYVMSDFAERNLAFWREHAWLQPFVQAGVLDFAQFDVERDQELRLVHSGEVLSSGSVRNPLVVISNYLFDSIPQDAFFVKEGRLFETLISLATPQPESDPTDPEILSRVEISYHNAAVGNQNYYADEHWNRLLLDYQQRLSGTAFLFPTAALQCIGNLRRLAGNRMLLLSGDRGYQNDEALVCGQGAPTITVHGSFSMMVDYQIIGEYCRLLGGEALHPGHASRNLNVSALIFGEAAGGFSETRQAYAEAIEKFGPDDFFTLKRGIDQLYGSLTLEETLAFLKLSGWDYKRFRQSLPALKKYLTNISDIQRQELARAVHRVWDSYLPIGEEDDLAFELGTLLIELERYSDAVEMLEQSVELYGLAAGTAYNIGVCHFSLGLNERALEYVNEAMILDPDFGEAKKLKAELASTYPAPV